MLDENEQAELNTLKNTPADRLSSGDIRRLDELTKKESGDTSPDSFRTPEEEVSEVEPVAEEPTVEAPPESPVEEVTPYTGETGEVFSVPVEGEAEMSGEESIQSEMVEVPVVETPLDEGSEPETIDIRPEGEVSIEPDIQPSNGMMTTDNMVA